MGTNTSIVWLVSSLASIPAQGLCAQPLEASDSPTRKITVKVIDDETQQPIAEATVRLSWADHKEDIVTDASGSFSFDWPIEGRLSAKCDAAGYATMRKWYIPSRGKAVVVPDTLIFDLPAGRMIGGRVVNEQQQPVAGATIKLTGTAKWNRDDDTTLQFDDLEIITDADGCWSYDRAPAEISWLTLDIKHPDYVAVSDQHSSESRSDRLASTALPLFYQNNGETTLQRGVEVQGTVVDPDGQPVTGAWIGTTSDRWRTPKATTTSRADGSWLFRSLEGEGFFIGVEAPGFAPYQATFAATPEALAMNITLPRGWPLRGRVVDPNGNPRADVRIAVETIGGDHMRRYPVNWSGKTDADGRFEWRNAPDDGFTLDIYGSDKLMRLSSVPVARSDDEITFAMHPALRFAGNVTDASTGEPITKFTIVPAVDFGGGGGAGGKQPMRQIRQEAQTYENADGSYVYPVTFPRDGHSLVFEADGYLPMQSGTYHNEDGSQTLDVALVRGTSIAGVVQLADGSPVAGATVHLANAGSPLFLYNGKPMEGRDDAGVHVETDEQGRFNLPAQSGPFAIVALSDAGIGIAQDASLKDLQPVVVLPWCRVEGTVMHGGEPVVERNMSLDPYVDPYDSTRFVVLRGQAKTDDRGRFTFERVAPGLSRVVEFRPLAENMSTSARFASFTAAPGEVVRVAIGSGSGATVLASVVPPDDGGDPMPLSNATFTLSAPSQPPLPDDWEDLSNEQRQGWMHDWQASMAGREWAKSQFRTARLYNMVLPDDGAMRIDSVAPGEYDVRIEVFAPGTEQYDPSNVIARYTGKASVPPDQATVDLGSLTLLREARLNVGEIAPAFAVTTLAGEPLNLADHRGKYVFLDFWAVWCGPCKAEIPNVKALHEAMKSRDDFVVISLSLDNDAALPTQFAKDNGMTWTQGFLGKWSDDVVTKAYGVRGIPATFLIAPDGRIAATNLRGEGLLAAVRKAMDLN